MKTYQAVMLAAIGGLTAIALTALIRGIDGTTVQTCALAIAAAAGIQAYSSKSPPDGSK